jgi:hypothetical protein
MHMTPAAKILANRRTENGRMVSMEVSRQGTIQANMKVAEMQHADRRPID